MYLYPTGTGPSRDAGPRRIYNYARGANGESDTATDNAGVGGVGGGASGDGSDGMSSQPFHRFPPPTLTLASYYNNNNILRFTHCARL